jgi:hypothetical protein
MAALVGLIRSIFLIRRRGERSTSIQTATCF